VVDTDDFAGVIARMQRYGGRTTLLESRPETALFAMSSGIRLRLQRGTKKDWGFHMVACTGSKTHLRKLTAVTGTLRQLKAESFPTEPALYRRCWQRRSRCRRRPWQNRDKTRPIEPTWVGFERKADSPSY